MIYYLTDAAKELTFRQWQALGGCMVSDIAQATINHRLKACRSQWSGETLGTLVAECRLAERELARFAFTNLDRPDLARPQGFEGQSVDS